MLKRQLHAKYIEFKLLFKCVPTTLMAIFVTSIIAMNILANKTIVNTQYLAIDGGTLISWISFLTMDIITKHFGPKAANKMCVFAVVINLFVSLIFYIVSIIPTPGYDYSSFNEIVGGTWFVLLSSTIAFILSAFINNFMNWTVGKLFKNNPDGKLAFMTRSYISTFIGQMFDNFIFSFLTFMIFAPIFWNGFSWTFIQVLMCSLLSAIFELLMQVIFTPIGYKISKSMKKEQVGEEYFKYLNNN